MKRVVAFLLALSFFLNPLVLYAADQLALPPLLEEALKSNPQILAAAKRYESAKARIPQAKALDDPVIGLKFEKAKGNPFNLDTTPAMDRMLSISQMLPFFGKLSLKGKIALVESQMYAAEYKDAQLEVINALEKAYYDLFMNYKEIELKQQSLDLLNSIAKVAEAKYAVSEVTQEEVLKIYSEIARLNNDLMNLSQIQSQKKTRLNTLLNREPEGVLGEPRLSENFDFSQDINYLYKATLENQPELLMFSYAIEKNKYAESLAKKSYFPDLMAGIVMRGLASGGIGPWDLMMAFSVPLWFWTKQKYQVKEAVANLEEAKSAYQMMKNRGLEETKNLFTAVEVSKNRIRLFQTDLIPILESSIASSLAAFRSGKGDFMLLLDSERMLIKTKMDYYAALVEYNMKLSDLKRQTGIDLKEVKDENK